MRATWGLLAVGGALALTGFALHKAVRVGDSGPRGVLAPSSQWIKPAGQTVQFQGRAMDVAWLEGGTLLLKTTGGLMEAKPGDGSPLQSLAASGGSSMSGLLVSPDGSTALFSNASNQVLVARRGADGRWAWKPSLRIPAPKIGGSPYPVGLAWVVPGQKAAVCLSRSNQVALFDLNEPASPRLLDVDLCPYGTALAPGGRDLLVTCWSRPAAAGELTQPSSGTEIPIMAGGRAKAGTLVRLNLESGQITGRLEIGLQPTEVLVHGARAYAASANSDLLTEIDLTRFAIVRTLKLNPVDGLPLGSSPSALALGSGGKTLYASCGGVNAVAAVDLASLKVKGWIPTGWHPGGVSVRDGRLAVAGIKGTGSRSEANPLKRTAYSWTTTLSVLPEPGGKELSAMTKEVLRQLEAPVMKDAMRPSSRQAMPAVVPARLGEPSLIKHVVFILKENRTYDQIFGDIKEAEGEPKLCLFPKDVTPNHHSLAEKFGLLDNYYCNGVLSADGHAWATEGQASTYFERSFGGWTRSYPFGDDPLAVSGAGYLWEDMIKKGITFRNFGEFDYAEPAGKESFKQVYDDLVSGAGKVRFTHNIGVAQLRRYSAPNYPGWNMGIPDVLRAAEFIKEFREMEKKGSMPQFTIIYLPQDHTSGDQIGMPTPRAHLADNDLALGRVMEALIGSRFWPDMAVFCNEDDPGGGLDHVDGHRSPCLVMSPYSRPGVNSSFYNQASVFGTMRRILGLPPLTKSDARAPLMFDCFQRTRQKIEYKALTPSVPLDELNVRKVLAGRLDLSGPDRGSDALRSRMLWASVRPGEPYPEDFEGAHGKGLKARGLKLDPDVKEDDDD